MLSMNIDSYFDILIGFWNLDKMKLFWIKNADQFVFNAWMSKQGYIFVILRIMSQGNFQLSLLVSGKIVCSHYHSKWYKSDTETGFKFSMFFKWQYRRPTGKKEKQSQNYYFCFWSSYFCSKGCTIFRAFFCFCFWDTLQIMKPVLHNSSWC